MYLHIETMHLYVEQLLENSASGNRDPFVAGLGQGLGVSSLGLRLQGFRLGQARPGFVGSARLGYTRLNMVGLGQPMLAC